MMLARPKQLDIIKDTALARAAAPRKTHPDLSTVARAGNRGDLSPPTRAKNPPELSTVAAAKNPGELSTGNLKAFEARRRAAGVSIARLCAAAEIHPDTYDDARAGRAKTRPGTMTKLHRALGMLAAGAVANEPITLCTALIRLVSAQIAVDQGEDPDAMLGQDFSVERPTAEWLRASWIRRCALYLIVEGLGVKKAHVGNAIGQSRQAVHKAVAAIEAERDRDTAFDATMQSLMNRLASHAGKR